MLYFKAQTYNTVLVLVNKSSFKSAHTDKHTHTHSVSQAGSLGCLLWWLNMDFCSGRSNLSAAGLYVWVYEEHSSYRCSLSRMVLTIKGATFPFSCLLSLSPLSVPYLTLFGWYSPVLKKGTFSPHVLTPPLAHRHTRQAKIEVVCPWACIASFFFFFFLHRPIFSLTHFSPSLFFLFLCFLFFFFPLPSSMLGHLSVTLQPRLRCGDRRPT